MVGWTLKAALEPSPIKNVLSAFNQGRDLNNNEQNSDSE